MADGASDERLVEINNELNSILEERITLLTTALKTTERLTQQIANTELDIKRNGEMQSKLEIEVGEIGGQLSSLTQTTDSLTAARDEKQNERFEREKEIQRLEMTISDKSKEIDNDDDKIRDLEKELSKLERENKKLKNRVKVLEEGVDRMRKVRGEYMKSIQDLNKEMTNLAGAQEQAQGALADAEAEGGE
jgi:chromosome segregation ATPase